MGKSNTLTHEEIWDDSSLVRSWDDAVEEYQVRSMSLFLHIHVITDLSMAALSQYPCQGRECRRCSERG